MKGKKSSFGNTAAGNVKSKHSHNHNHNNKYNNKNNKDTAKDTRNDAQHKEGCVDDHDKDLNSGFGDYLRTPEAVEMMKLFVFANTIMLILTMAWPNLKQQYYMVRQWIESYQTE